MKEQSSRLSTESPDVSCTSPQPRTRDVIVAQNRNPEKPQRHKVTCLFSVKSVFNNFNSSLLSLSRIQPLAEALDDLYKEFNALKVHLGDLTEKFTAIESFIDEVKAGRAAQTNAGPAAAGPAQGGATVPRQNTRRVMKKKMTSSAAAAAAAAS